jgi:hypothetical protein
MKTEDSELHPAFAGSDYPAAEKSRPAEVAKLADWMVQSMPVDAVGALFAAMLIDQGRAHEALSLIKGIVDDVEAAQAAKRAKRGPR